MTQTEQQAKNRVDAAIERLMRVTEEIAHPECLILGCDTNCSKCKRTMIPGERFANGYLDRGNLCHRCRAQIDMEMQGEETPFDIESHERRYGQ